jgi:hypothetical protein
MEDKATLHPLVVHTAAPNVTRSIAACQLQGRASGWITVLRVARFFPESVSEYPYAKQNCAPCDGYYQPSTAVVAIKKRQEAQTKAKV